jgi:hypothetical protein
LLHDFTPLFNEYLEEVRQSEQTKIPPPSTDLTTLRDEIVDLINYYHQLPAYKAYRFGVDS